MKSKLRCISALLLSLILVLGLTACNFTTSVSKKAKPEDVREITKEISVINPVHVEMTSIYSANNISELGDLWQKAAILTGIGELDLSELTGDNEDPQEFKIIADIDKSSNITYLTLNTDSVSMDIINANNKSYVNVKFLIDMLKEMGIPIGDEQLYNLTEFYDYLDTGEEIDIANITDMSAIEDAAESGYFDMQFSKEKNNGSSIINISMKMQDTHISDWIEHVGLSDDVSINAEDVDVELLISNINNGENYQITIKSSISGVSCSLVYNFSKSTATLEEPNPRRILTEDNLNNGTWFDESDFDFGDTDSGFDDELDPGFTFGDTEDNDSSSDEHDNLPIDSSSSLMLIPAESYSPTIEKYDTVFTINNSEFSQQYKPLGEFDYVSDFRRAYSNTYNTVFRQLQSAGFEEAYSSSDEFTESTTYDKRDSNDKFNEKLTASSYITGGTFISYGLEVGIDNGAKLTNSQIKDIITNIEYYTGIALTEDDILAFESMCDSGMSKGNDFYTIDMEDNNINNEERTIEFTKFNHMISIDAGRNFSS